MAKKYNKKKKSKYPGYMSFNKGLGLNPAYGEYGGWLDEFEEGGKIKYQQDIGVLPSQTKYVGVPLDTEEPPYVSVEPDYTKYNSTNYPNYSQNKSENNSTSVKNNQFVWSQGSSNTYQSPEFKSKLQFSAERPPIKFNPYLRGAVDVAGIFFYPASVVGAGMDLIEGDNVGAALGLIPYAKAGGLFSRGVRDLYTYAINKGLSNRIAQPAKIILQKGAPPATIGANMYDTYSDFKQYLPNINQELFKGSENMYKEGGFIGKTTVEAGGAKHVVYTGKKGDIMVTHPEMDNGAWDTINLTEVSDAKSLAQGVDATLDWHRKHPYHKKKKAEGGYMTPLDLNPATLKKYTKAVKIQENEGKVGFNPKTGLWTPHESVEKGNPTIAYGHKLKAGEDFSKGITEQQALKMLADDIKYHEQNAKSIVDEKFGKGTFDSLHQDKQMLLTDYSFNGVLSEFPLFTEGLVEGDKKKMFGQYKRYTKDLPLKKRNAWTLEVLEGIPSKEEEKKQDFDRRVQEELDKLTKEREYQAKPWYTRAYDYVRGLMPFEDGGYIYQEGGRTPIYVDDPRDPRLKAYNDSLNVYNNAEPFPKDFSDPNRTWIYVGDPNRGVRYETALKSDFFYYPKNKDNKILDKFAVGEYGKRSVVPVYKKPIQPYKYKKPEVAEEEKKVEPVVTKEVKKEEPIDRSILTYRITELPKEEQRGNQRYVATVVPETYQKYGTGFAERYPLTQEQYDAMGATDTMKSREGKDVPVKYLKKYGGRYRAPKYNDKRIGRGDDGGEVWLYEEGGWLDEL